MHWTIQATDSLELTGLKNFLSCFPVSKLLYLSSPRLVINYALLVLLTVLYILEKISKFEKVAKVT